MVTTEFHIPTAEDCKDNENSDVLNLLNSLECGREEITKILERTDFFPSTINSQTSERGSLLT